MKKAFCLLVVLILLLPAAVFAEEKFGVQVYPGAKYDPGTSGLLKESMGVDGFCYRTGDSVKKVADFYKDQGLTPAGGATTQGAMFQTKTGVDVTIQNPWMDMNTGKMNKDTLISIVKRK